MITLLAECNIVYTNTLSTLFLQYNLALPKKLFLFFFTTFKMNWPRLAQPIHL